MLRDIMVSIGRTGRATPFAVLEPVFVGGATVGDGDAAQRGRGRAQGRAARRHRDRAQGRRRDPRGGRAGARRSGRRGTRRVEVPDSSARRAASRSCASKARPTTTASTSTARRSGCSGSCTSPAAARWTSRGSARSACASSSTPACSRTPPTSTRSPSSELVAARTDRRALGAAARRRDRGARSSGRCGACSSASASTTSGRPPRRRSRAASPTSTRSRPRRTRSSPRSTVSGRSSRESIGQWFTIDRNRRLVEKLREAGVNLDGRRRARRVETVDDSFAGLTFVLTGSLERHTRDEAAAAIAARGGEGHRQRVEEDELRRGRREPRVEARRRPRQLGVPVLDEAGVRGVARGRAVAPTDGVQPTLNAHV